MPFGQNLITSAALKAAPAYDDYYGADYYGTEYNDYNEVEVEEYYYEGIISTRFVNWLNLGNFEIFFQSEIYLALNSWVKSALKIVWNDINIAYKI